MSASLIGRYCQAPVISVAKQDYFFGSERPKVAVLGDSGFSSISVETKVEPARFPSSRHMAEAELRGWLPLFGIFLDEARINDVLIESDKTLSRYAESSGEAVFPSSAHVITARKG